MLAIKHVPPTFHWPTSGFSQPQMLAKEVATEAAILVEGLNGQEGAWDEDEDSRAEPTGSYRSKHKDVP